MIANDQELECTMSRIAWFQNQVAFMRRKEQSATNYHASAGGFLTEIAKMQREVREYLSVHPSEIEHAAAS